MKIIYLLLFVTFISFDLGAIGGKTSGGFSQSETERETLLESKHLPDLYKVSMERLAAGNSLDEKQRSPLIATLITQAPFPLWSQEGLKHLLESEDSMEAKVLRATMALTELSLYWPSFDPTKQ